MKVSTIFRRPYFGITDPGVVRRHIFVLTNMERSRHGLGPVQASRRLDDVAERHSANMMAAGFFDHVDPSGRSPQDRLALIHPELLATVGENIARLPADRDDRLAAATVNLWMNSEGHRRTILTPAFTHLGIGISRGGVYAHVTQLFGCCEAILLDPVPPVRLRGAVGGSLLLSWLGGERDPNLVAWVRCPHDRAMRGPDGSMYKGAFPIAPVWRGPTFQILFPAGHQSGPYHLHLGSRGGGHSPVSIPIRLV